MLCPRCPDRTLTEKERDGVTLDLCPECRGVWLDRGELERILSRTRTELDAIESSRPPARDSDDEPRRREKSPYDSDDHWERPDDRRGQHPPRKRGFLHSLGELFD